MCTVPHPASPHEWALQTFGATQLGDQRRTTRLVQLAAAMASCPAGSLPQQVGSWALKGAYRFLDNAAVDFASIVQPHCVQTRQAGTPLPVLLLVQDTTVLDCSRHRMTLALGPIGNGGGYGFQWQTVLAVDPDNGVPVGVLAAEPWVRSSAPPDESRRQRARRPRESERWGRMVEVVGPPPADRQWVHVADREADCFAFLAAVADIGADVLVRIAQNRRVVTDDGTMERLFTALEAAPAADQRAMPLPQRSRHPQRSGRLAISWQAVQVLPPVQAPPSLATHPPIAAWAIRVWESNPPDGIEPIGWQLLTTVPVSDAADAWERVHWYTRRWVIEEFHQCLKTGCTIEGSQLRDGTNLCRQLAILLPLAVRLLHLRALSRAHPELSATELASPLLRQLIATHLKTEPATTVGALLQQVARLGGWLGRKNDGPPGWRTIWRGWLRALSWLEGAELARSVESR